MVPSPKRIPDKYMTSSSYQSGYQAFRGRIGLQSRGSWGDGWCASEADVNPYIQIFFGALYNFLYNIFLVRSLFMLTFSDDLLFSCTYKLTYRYDQLIDFVF